jgi:hypothetical protein
MTEDRIDEHIAHFKVLLVKAGWNRSDKGSIDLFNGLTKSVQRKILSLYAILPVTLDEWQSAARQVVQRYRLMDIKLGPWRPREHESNSKVGWNQGRQVSGQGCNPDAMDIDVTEIDVNAAQAGKPVTCYYCNNKGHMKKDCCKFEAAQQEGEDESLGAETTATTFENNRTRGEARRASPDPDSLMVHINRLRIEDRWDFMECLFGLETSDHDEETAYLRATKVHMTHARKIKAIHADLKLLTMQRATEERALLDSGASENLINKETWKTLGTRTFTLPKPITIYNIDGTENRQGKVTQYCWLKIRKGNEEQ